MPVHTEWIEWHLTPRGWETVAAAFEDGDMDGVPSPRDRVLTYHYAEEHVPCATCVRRSIKVIWHCGDSERIQRLVARYGDCPPDTVAACRR
jgi:hypothetical protein